MKYIDIIERMKKIVEMNEWKMFDEYILKTKMIEKQILNADGEYIYSDLMFYLSAFGISDYEKVIEIIKSLQ